MQTSQGDLQALKERMRETWMAGDFGQIARYTTGPAEEFVDRLGPMKDKLVLDVACGTGNLAIPAARKGARVIGVDIAENLLEQACERALAEHLHATFEEGDAEHLSYADAQFDVVMTMFGAMFAPRPERVAAELARVCRHGDTIAMANWTPEGFVGQTFALMGRHVPPPEGIPAPILWGTEKTVWERLGPYATEINTVRRTLIFDYPFSPRHVVQFFREYFGPTRTAFSRLDEARQAALATDLENFWSEHNQSGSGGTLIRGEYLEVIAKRA
jgi:ubiquinone/menaquinone biosynthesis C-methylase UbiE